MDWYECFCIQKGRLNQCKLAVLLMIHFIQCTDDIDTAINAAIKRRKYIQSELIEHEACVAKTLLLCQRKHRGQTTNQAVQEKHFH